MPSYIRAPSSPNTHTLLFLCLDPNLTPLPQSAVLFLESLLGQENVYTMAMVRRTVLVVSN